MKKLNYIFVGGKRLGFETLTFLSKKNFIPLCVVPNNDDIGRDNAFNKSVVKLAKSKNFKIIQLRSLYKFLKKNKFNVDVIFCLGSTKILPQEIVKIPKLGSFNIHPSLLPKYKGLNTFKRVIKNKEKLTGCTVHYVNNKLDSGKIIMKKKVFIKFGESEETLKAKVQAKEYRIYSESIINIFR